MSTKQAQAVDFSKYASPELISTISRLANFLEDSLVNLFAPPAVILLSTLLLTYFLPFSSSLTSTLFLIVGVIGGALTGLAYGAFTFVGGVARDLKAIVVQSILLIENIMDDIASYAHDPSSIPPVSEMVRGIVNSILIPVVHGVFKKKFYGRIVLKFLEPAIRNVGKFTSASIAKIETKSTDSTPEATIVEEKYDRKSRDDRMLASESDAKQVANESVNGKRKRMEAVLNSAEKRILPAIDKISEIGHLLHAYAEGKHDERYYL